MSLYGKTPFDTASRVSATLRVAPTLALEADVPHPLPRFAAEGQIAASSSWTFDEGESTPSEGDPLALACLDRLRGLEVCQSSFHLQSGRGGDPVLPREKETPSDRGRSD